MGVGVCEPPCPTTLANMEVRWSILVASGTGSPLGCWWWHYLVMLFLPPHAIHCLILGVDGGQNPLNHAGCRCQQEDHCWRS